MEISFINDELSDNIDEVLAFAKKNELKYIELRRIDGKPVEQLTKDMAFALSEKIANSGILVSALATSFLKEKADEQSVDAQKEKFASVMDLADICGAPNVRIYSYLKDETISLEDLGKRLDVFSQMALERGLNLLLENDRDCCIDTISQMHQLLDLYGFSNIFPLLNLGETIASGDDFSPQELQDVVNKCLYFHIKDYDADLKRWVVLGEGHADYEPIFADKKNDKAVIFSLDTGTGYPEDLKMSLNILQSFEDDEED